MARSSKWFDLKDYANVDLPPTSLFIATREDAPLYADQLRFWELLEETNVQRGLVIFEGSYHAIPGVTPEQAAEQTRLALAGQLAKESTVIVEEQGPDKSVRRSLLDYSQLTEDSWETSNEKK
jgi:hypothetical protein